MIINLTHHFQFKNFDIFLIFVNLKNIDCWHTIESPQLGASYNLCLRTKKENNTPVHSRVITETSPYKKYPKFASNI